MHLITRRFLVAGHADWRAVRDARGQWVIVSRDGREPLRSADPLERLRAVHMAAQAPALLTVASEAAEILLRLVEHSGCPKRDRQILFRLLNVIDDARPDYREEAPLLLRPVLELDLGADPEAA